MDYIPCQILDLAPAFPQFSSFQSKLIIPSYFATATSSVCSPWVFHSKALLTMLFVYIHNMWQIQFHFLYLISCRNSYRSYIFYISLFDMVLGHMSPKWLSNSCLYKTCNLFPISFLAFQVSQSCNTIDKVIVEHSNLQF